MHPPRQRQMMSNAINHGTAYPQIGVSAKWNTSRFIILACSVEQPLATGTYQIIEFEGLTNRASDLACNDVDQCQLRVKTLKHVRWITHPLLHSDTPSRSRSLDVLCIKAGSSLYIFNKYRIGCQVLAQYGSNKFEAFRSKQSFEVRHCPFGVQIEIFSQCSFFSSQLLQGFTSYLLAKRRCQDVWTKTCGHDEQA